MGKKGKLQKETEYELFNILSIVSTTTIVSLIIGHIIITSENKMCA